MTDEAIVPTPAAKPVVDVGMIKFIDVVQAKKDLFIDTTDLASEMQQHSGRCVEYGMISVKARRQFERNKLVMELLEGQLDSEHRAILKEENPKATEGSIRSAVVVDSRYRAASIRVIDSQEQHRMAEIVYGQFHQRGDMLMQLARDAAREGSNGGQMRVMSTVATGATAADIKGRYLEKAAAAAAA